MFELAVNGRYLTRPVSGVERTAHNLLAAVTRELARSGRPMRIRHYIPARAALMAPVPGGGEVVRGGRLTGHAWEQIELPRLRREALLFSPCNTGPIAARGHVVTVHDAQVYTMPASYSAPFRTWYRILLPALLRRAVVATTVSDHSRRQLETVGAAPAGKLAVVPNGCDHILSIAPDAGILARHDLVARGYFLVIGSMSAHKNVGIAIEGIRRAAAGMPLVVAGGGDPAVFAQRGIIADRQVRVIGRVSDGELRALYDQATGLLFPSLDEGFGLPPVEAMACGCPVIASRAGAMPEVCADAALYAAPHDAGEWAAAIDRIAADTALRSAMIEKGRARAAALDWASAARRLIALIDGAAALS